MMAKRLCGIRKGSYKDNSHKKTFACKLNASGVASSAARIFDATGQAAEDDFFCKLRLRGAKQATPHQTPPSTPSTIFRKTVAILHSGVKVLSAQKNAHFLLRFRFFVLLLGQAIRHKRRESRCRCVNVAIYWSAAIRGKSPSGR